MDGAPLKFERSKTKELFAYLVDRKGAASNTGELCAVLWEDKPDSVSLRNQLRTLLSDLSRSLKSVQAEDILIKNRNHFAVATDKMDCDFYSFLQKEAAAVNHYTGESVSYTHLDLSKRQPLFHAINSDSLHRRPLRQLIIPVTKTPPALLLQNLSLRRALFYKNLKLQQGKVK